MTTRRDFLRASSIAATFIGTTSQSSSLLANWPGDSETTAPKHLLSSSLFGYSRLEEILPIAKRLGINSLDIWPKVHGNQREQLAEMGEDRFVELLSNNGCRLDCLTQYPLGPFGLADEMRLAKRLGCQTIVTGSGGPKGLQGDELKASIREFVEKLKPHLELAHQTGVRIAIENHANNIIDSPDSLKYLMDFRPNSSLGIAFAPYHLEQDSEKLAQLIRQLGEGITIFYAWQHGNGCMQAQPKESELLQMPGRGSLDFKPIVAALKEIEFQGWTEIFMHPFPRGVPILENRDDVTAEINRARAYLESLIS